MLKYFFKKYENFAPSEKKPLLRRKEEKKEKKNLNVFNQEMFNTFSSPSSTSTSMPAVPSATSAPPNVTSTSMTTAPSTLTLEALEVAGRCAEKWIHADSQFPPLGDKLRIGNKIETNPLINCLIV